MTEHIDWSDMDDEYLDAQDRVRRAKAKIIELNQETAVWQEKLLKREIKLNDLEKQYIEHSYDTPEEHYLDRRKH